MCRQSELQVSEGVRTFRAEGPVTAQVLGGGGVGGGLPGMCEERGATGAPWGDA